tara:strand:+ start:277 stop:480 length:204 start_codon:yes stop_codon:yes gene_type:complete
MIELVICEHIRNGYKVVVPKNTHLKLLTKYAPSIYRSPSDVKPNDKLKFVGWVSATDEDRNMWRSYL